MKVVFGGMSSANRKPTGDKKGAEIRKSYSRIPEQSDDQLREIIANTYGVLLLTIMLGVS